MWKKRWKMPCLDRSEAAKQLSSQAAKLDNSEISQEQQTDNSYSSNPLILYSSNNEVLL